MKRPEHDTLPRQQAMLPAMTATHASFDELVARHRRAVHVHCYRMVGSFSDAEDLVQETLLRAWRALGSFDPATGDDGFRRWLYRIATNARLDLLTSAPRRVRSGRSS